jgi:hypothetical protein
MLPADVSFMGLQLHITENVFPIDESMEGDPYHQAVRPFCVLLVPRICDKSVTRWTATTRTEMAEWLP